MNIMRLFLLFLLFDIQPWLVASEQLVDLSASLSTLAGVARRSGKPFKKPKGSGSKKYSSMKELFEKSPIGPTLKAASQPTKYAYKFAVGYATVFEATKALPQYDMQVGDLFYLDKSHGDHIEVFDSTGTKPRTVFNWDGTKNDYKLQQAIKQNRQITKEIQERHRE